MISYLSQQDILSDINTGYNNSIYFAGKCFTTDIQNLEISNLPEVYVKGVFLTSFIPDNQPSVGKIQKLVGVFSSQKSEYHLIDIRLEFPSLKKNEFILTQNQNFIHLK